MKYLFLPEAEGYLYTPAEYLAIQANENLGNIGEMVLT